MPDLVDFVALSLLPSWCWLTAAEWLRAGDRPGDVLRRICERHWRDRPDYIVTLREQATAAARRGVDHGLTAVVWTDAAYPIALTTIPDPPAMLWTRGTIAALNAPAVAIVGSRAASPYALSVAEQLAHDLAVAGLVVVSGLARGVDSAAHRGTLAAGGATIGVLGSGADVIYPRENEALVREIERDGVVISELVPGTPPRRRTFEDMTDRVS